MVTVTCNWWFTIFYSILIFFKASFFTSLSLPLQAKTAACTDLPLAGGRASFSRACPGDLIVTRRPEQSPFPAKWCRSYPWVGNIIQCKESIPRFLLHCVILTLMFLWSFSPWKKTPLVAHFHFPFFSSKYIFSRPGRSQWLLSKQPRH